MPTKINLIQQKKKFFHKNFLEDVYCNEDPLEVLKQFLPEYRVAQYKNLRLVNETVYSQQNLFLGLGITDFSNESVSVNGNLKDFNFGNIDFLRTENFNPLQSINYLILSYLIEREIEEEGSAISINRIPQVNKKGKQRFINNLVYPGEKADKIRETYLNNILEYARTIFEDFNKKDLERLTEKIIKKMPIEFNPLPTEYIFIPSRSNFFEGRIEREKKD